jgi:hypothetical protein
MNDTLISDSSFNDIFSIVSSIMIDTLMIVKYPTKFQFRKTKKYQILIQLMIFLFSFLL